MKIFEAKRTAGVITADGGAVIDCPVLGEGGDSEGVIVMAEGELVYIPKRSPDLSTTLQLLSTALFTIASGIYQANMGGDITSPTFAQELADIKKQVDELRGKLK
jgi:hypothetical protein